MSDFSKITLNGVSYDISDDAVKLEIAKLKVKLGCVVEVSLKSAMTDTKAVYVYNGVESGMTAGNWYYYLGDAWVSGGSYSGADGDVFEAIAKDYWSDFAGPGIHNALYRGKNLGTALTAAQSATIQAGEFDDIFVGDYWQIDNIKWLVADLDYWYRSGDMDCTTHHVLVIPETTLYNHVMNDTNITTGAYVGSKMYTEGLETAKTTLTNAFGSSHILTHRDYLQNAVTDGRCTSGSWYDSSVELMSEPMVYGTFAFDSSSATGAAVYNRYTVACKQLNLFRHRPDMIVALNPSGGRQWYWLRNVASAANFCGVGSNGGCAYYYASDSYGVRPFALIY